MQNRRNYYRILQVQPDAPVEVIKNNYRTLLQKLRLHPDLGGDDWNASVVNVAYSTLRNPAKRKAYDRALLKRYGVGVLSLGRLATRKFRTRENVTHDGKNRRNYYRLLKIQPDASSSIINSSYRLLLNKQIIPEHLLNEARQVLNDPTMRREYDALLRLYPHHRAIQKITTVSYGKSSSKKKKPQRKKPTQARRKHIQLVDSLKSYQPVISQYCEFCKTPYSSSKNAYHNENCIECGSPLYSLDMSIMEQSGRVIDRAKTSANVSVYSQWPGQQMHAILTDISPVGMRIKTPVRLIDDQVIKIESDQFQAVGKVTHQQFQGGLSSAGVQFLTIQFEQQKGSFLSTTA